MTTFLRASTNNHADTVLTAFQGAITEFGLPSRVRMDKGGENVHVAQYMLEQLDYFKIGWSHHGLRTENNRTPMQLWVSGLLKQTESFHNIHL